MTTRPPLVIGSDGLFQQLQSGDSIDPAPVTVNPAGSTYTVLTTDHDLIFAKAITLTLPAAASFVGRELWMKVTGAFAVTSASSNVVPVTSTTAGTAILAATAGKWCRMISNGTNWVIMAAN